MRWNITLFVGVIKRRPGKGRTVGGWNITLFVGVIKLAELHIVAELRWNITLFVGVIKLRNDRALRDIALEYNPVCRGNKTFLL